MYSEKQGALDLLTPIYLFFTPKPIFFTPKDLNKSISRDNFALWKKLALLMGIIFRR